MGDDCTRTDNRVVSDGDAGADHHIAAQPHIVADGHVGVVLPAFQSRLAGDGVVWRIDAHARADQAIGADGDRAAPTISRSMLMNVRSPIFRPSP